jgi:hypothetical protein
MAEHHFNLSSSLGEEERNKTLQELDGHDWGEPNFPSYLVRTCHALRRKPLRDFSVEDLRIMIGQNFSLEYLVPLAIEHLRRDPFAAGDFYPGDLLINVLRVKSSFWQQRPDLRHAIENIIALIPSFPEDFRKDLSKFQQM